MFQGYARNTKESDRLEDRQVKYQNEYRGYPKRYSKSVMQPSGRDLSKRYWWRCFSAAAQRMMKKPIQRAARWNGIAS